MLSYKVDLFDRDLTKYPYNLYLAAIFLLSRIPFITLGFGPSSEFDSLAVANSAYLLRHFHVYAVSRYPGSPFYESVNALLIDGGWTATNTATLFVSLACVFVFGTILNDLKIKNKALLLVTFTFMPIIWINSTITMDYMWSLLFILIACHCMFSDRYTLSGLFMGLAVGNRFTSIFMIVPLTYWLYLNKVENKNVLNFIVTSVLTSAAIFLPVFYRYGLDFLHVSGFTQTPLRQPIWTAISIGLFTINNLIDVLLGGFAVLFIISIAFCKIIYKKKSEQSDNSNCSIQPLIKKDFLFRFSSLIIIIFFTNYIVFPFKTGYLIPIVPWGLILLNEVMSQKLMAVLSVLILLNGFVSFGIAGGNDGVYIGNGILPDNLSLKKGFVLQNYIDRKTTGLPMSEQYMKSIITSISN